MDYFQLHRNYFNWCFENPDKVKPIHTAIFCFAIEHCNRLGWKEKFGFPTTMAMEALGIKSYNTFINGLKDLVEFGFITMVEKSKNQYSANIIALSNFNKAHDKALDKALIKHSTKQSESTDSIIKQDTNTQETTLQSESVKINLDFTKDKFKTEQANKAWVDWLEYRYQEGEPVNRKRQPYVKKELVKLATINGQLNETVLIEIIKKCIAMGWKNLQLTDEMEAKLKKWQAA